MRAKKMKMKIRKPSRDAKVNLDINFPLKNGDRVELKDGMTGTLDKMVVENMFTRKEKVMFFMTIDQEFRKGVGTKYKGKYFENYRVIEMKDIARTL